MFEALMCFFINRGAQNVACVGGCVVVPVAGSARALGAC